jgi:hypothetical protein
MGDRDKAYDYFVKSYLPNSRDRLLVFFSESANSNNLILQLEQGLCFKRLFMDLVV